MYTFSVNKVYDDGKKETVYLALKGTGISSTGMRVNTLIVNHNHRKFASGGFIKFALHDARLVKIS